MTKSRGYHGNMSYNPYLFEDFNVRTIVLSVDGVQIGGNEIMNFEQNQLGFALERLYDTFPNCKISLKDFKKGSTLFVYKYV